MTHLLPSSHLAAVALDPGVNHRGLVIIFAFIIALILIRGYFRQRRIQLWHDTARLALEKGQPLPPRFGPGWGGNFARWGAWRDLRRGLILLAVGGGLYLADTGRVAVAILGCVGAVYLVLGLIGLMRGDKPSDFRNQPPKT